MVGQFNDRLMLIPAYCIFTGDDNTGTVVHGDNYNGTFNSGITGGRNNSNNLYNNDLRAERGRYLAVNLDIQHNDLLSRPGTIHTYGRRKDS